MLVLSRKVGEKIIIADNITITVVEAKGPKVRLGIEAPRTVRVDRAEVAEAIRQQAENEAKS
jgi:carbon storage regulator